MKYTRIIGIAIACHVAGWAIIALQFALTAVTLMPIIAIPFLNWIPPLTVLVKGFAKSSKTLIVSFPVFLAIWLVPSALYRLAILPAYYSTNAPSETQLFGAELPSELLFRRADHIHEETRLLLHGGALSELTAAFPWDNAKDIIYDAERRTVDLRHLLFETYRKEELSNCRAEDLDTKILLQDFGAPACLKIEKPDQSLPQHIIFDQVQDGPIKITHSIFGKITPTDTPDLYGFEELGRHTQRFKVFRVPALLPIFWIPSDRASSNHPFFFMVKWQAGSEEALIQDLILEAYLPKMKEPEYPVENHVNFRRRFEYGLRARAARSGPNEKLDGLFSGSTPETLAARLAEIDAALPSFDRHPAVSRMHALKRLRIIAEFLCVSGYANETTSFILGSWRTPNALLEECHQTLSTGELQAQFVLGEEAARKDELRQQARSQASEAATARYGEIRREPLKIAVGKMDLTYRLRQERRDYVLEIRLHEKGRTFKKPATLGMANGEQPETLFMGTDPSRSQKNHVSVSNAHRFGNAASMVLSEADVTLISLALEADAPVLVLNHGEQSLRLPIAEHNAVMLEDMIAKYQNLLALRAIEDEYTVPRTSW